MRPRYPPKRMYSLAGAPYGPGASRPDSGTPEIGASANSTPDTACGPASPYQVG